MPPPNGSSLVRSPPDASSAMAADVDSTSLSTPQRLQDVTSRLGALQGELRRAKRTIFSKEAVPEATWAVARVIAVLTHPDVGPAVDFIVRRKPKFEGSRDCLERKLQSFCDGRSEEERQLMMAGPMTKKDAALRARAETFLAERHLCAWVEEQNVQKGIAPLSGVLLEQTRGRLGRRGMKRKSELQWLRRWRRRWGVTWGSFQSRDTVTVECGQKKACCRRFRDPQFGARELPQGRAWAVRGLQKRGRIAAPKSGPQRQLIRPGGPRKRTLFLKKTLAFLFSGEHKFWVRVLGALRLARPLPCGAGATSCTARCRRARSRCESTWTRRRFDWFKQRGAG